MQTQFYYVGMDSVTLASRYQSRPSMYIGGCSDCDFSFLQTTAGSFWTEDIADRGITPNQVNSPLALGSFSDWLNEANQINSLPGHDHAMLFTG